MIISKLFCILLGIEVFALTYFLSALVIGYLNFGLLTYYIPFVIGAALGALTYYLVDLAIKRKQENKEKLIKQTLLPLLPTGETLRAYTSGWAYDDRPWRQITRKTRDVIFGNPREIWFHVGVTDQSLIIVWSDGNRPTVTEHVLSRSQVQQVRFDNIPISGPQLFIQFAAEPMILRISWRGGYNTARQAKELAKIWNGNV